MREPEPSLLIALYLRVSTEEQARKGYSLPEQRELCRTKARQIAEEAERSAGRPVQPEVVEFVDDFGGDIAERPALEAVREFVRARRPAWLVCMDPDRFSRSLKLQLIVADDIEGQGTRLAFVQQDYDPADMMSRAFFQFRGLMAELDKAKIIERTTRGKKGKVKAGKRPNGACPYGYRHNKATDRLEVYEPEAQWVRQMFRWVAEEQAGIYQVARRLNDFGVPRKRTGARWYRSTVGSILRNTSYMGEMRCNRRDFRGLASVRRLPRARRKPLSPKMRPQAEWVTVPVPPIVSRAEFEAAQTLLAATARRGGCRNTGLLSMMLRCGVCGGSMAYARHSGGRVYLRCQRRWPARYDYRLAEPCGNPHHRAGPVEARVWQTITEWLTEPALTEEFLAAGGAAGGGALAEQKGLLERQLEEKRTLQIATVEKQAAGLLPPAVADALLASARGQAERIEAELAGVRARLAALPERGALPAEGWAADEIRRDLAALSEDGRRHLVRRLLRAVILHGSGELELVARA